MFGMFIAAIVIYVQPFVVNVTEKQSSKYLGLGQVISEYGWYLCQK